MPNSYAGWSDAELSDALAHKVDVLRQLHASLPASETSAHREENYDSMSMTAEFIKDQCDELARRAGREVEADG